MSSPSARPLPPNRNIALAIVLTIITCGIYDLVWDYYLGREIREHTQRWDINPGLDVFFMIITCNIYYFFWLYKMARIMQRQEAVCFPNQRPSVMDPALLVILALVGATVISDAVLQYDLNEHWDRHQA